MSIPLFVSERSKSEITKRPLSMGCLVFERMDQADFTGPFEVLSRMPDTTVQIIGKAIESVRDVQGLRLSPDVRIVKAWLFTILRNIWLNQLRQRRTAPDVIDLDADENGAYEPADAVQDPYSAYANRVERE